MHNDQQYDEISGAMASSYAPPAEEDEHLPAGLVCTHADRSKGEQLCSICQSATQAILDKSEPVTKVIFDEVYRKAVREAVEAYAPNLAVLQESSGRFIDAKAQTPVKLCVHSNLLTQPCALCSSIAAHLGYGS